MQAAELLNQFMMLSFRVGGPPSTFLTGAAVDEIMKIGGWKTEWIAKHHIGATSSGQVGSMRKCGQTLASYHCRRVCGK